MTTLQILKTIRQRSKYKHQLENVLRWLEGYSRSGKDIGVQDVRSVAESVREVLK